MKELTFGHLHSIYYYDNSDCNFYRKVPTRRNKVGSIVSSCFDRDGYELISVIGLAGSVRKHRLVWFYFHGEWPINQIDHIDRNKNNNRIENLRVVTDAENKMNMPLYKNNKTGVCGVHWNKARQKWKAKITVASKIYILGHFDDFEEAVDVRKHAEKEFGFSSDHGLKTEQLPPEVAVSA